MLEFRINSPNNAPVLTSDKPVLTFDLKLNENFEAQLAGTDIDLDNLIITAAGDGFVSYRILVGQGLNPQEWIQVAEGNEPVTNDVLAEWDTTGLSGLYAVQLQVLRSDQKVETAIIQVTIKDE